MKAVQTHQVLFTIALAVIFWILTFGIQALNFWLSMSLAASILAMLALFFGGKPYERDLHFPSLFWAWGGFSPLPDVRASIALNGCFPCSLPDFFHL